MIFKGDVYMVYVDGCFVGLCEDEDEICDVAQDSVNGISTLLDDDYPDRVGYDKINVSRFYVDGQSMCDKLNKTSILCYNYMEARNGVERLNRLNLQKERAEAKLRAMAL